MEDRKGGLRGLKANLFGNPSVTIIQYASMDHKFTLKRKPKGQVQIALPNKAGK